MEFILFLVIPLVLVFAVTEPQDPAPDAVAQRCLHEQPDVTAQQRVAHCTSLLATPDTAMRARFLNGRGTARYELGDLSAARKDYDAGLALDPENPDIRYNRAVAAYELHDDAAALADLDRLISGGAATAEVLELRSDVQHELGRHAEALRDIDAALALEPPDAERLFARGQTLIELGRPEEAIAPLSEALALAPNDRDALERRATAYGLAGRRTDALADAARLLALDPSDADAHHMLCMALTVSAPATALTHCDRALAAHPDAASTWNSRSIVLEIEGDAAKAREAADKALELSPQEPVFLANRAILAMRQGDFDRAQKDLDTGLAVAPGFHLLRVWQPMLRLVRGDVRGAQTMVEQLLSEDPRDPDALCDLGWVRLAQGRILDARRAFQQVLDHPFPPDEEVKAYHLRWTALYGRGLANLRAGRVAEGEADLASARRMRPDADAVVARWGPALASRTAVIPP